MTSKQLPESILKKIRPYHLSLSPEDIQEIIRVQHSLTCELFEELVNLKKKTELETLNNPEENLKEVTDPKTLDITSETEEDLNKSVFKQIKNISICKDSPLETIIKLDFQNPIFVHDYAETSLDRNYRNKVDFMEITYKRQFRFLEIEIRIYEKRIVELDPYDPDNREKEQQFEERIIIVTANPHYPYFKDNCKYVKSLDKLIEEIDRLIHDDDDPESDCDYDSDY